MASYGPENALLKRISIKNIQNSILLLLNLEKGIGYTLVNLAIRPGEAINTYLFEDRSKMVKPVGFLVFVISIATFLTVSFIDLESIFAAGVVEGMSEAAKDNPSKVPSFGNEDFSRYNNIFMLFGVPVLAFCSYLLYSKYLYNYAEHLVISAFLTSFATVIYILLIPFFMKWYIAFTALYMLLIAIYFVFAYKQVFGESWKISILKGIGLQMLYYTFLSVFMIIIGVIVGLVLILKAKG